MSARIAITRVVNACVVLELDGGAVLTDPYFDSHWFIGLREPIGLKVAELPRLAAILGGHGVFDHWQPGSMASYPFKAETPVFVATRSMAAKARSAGFEQVSVVDWGDVRALPGGLEVEVAPSQIVTGMKTNSYVISSAGRRIFIGTEARDLEPLRRYRASRPGVDVALLPIDSASLMGHKLVMDPRDAIEATRILGAKTLVPIHYALKGRSFLLQTPFSDRDLLLLARDAPDIDVVCLSTGTRWEHGLGAAAGAHPRHPPAA
ncbi:MBL fold metallo-hydrolase [Sorangium sp. So ce1504]|uniref:MBL fold metallo-hydrolase n=1 Tax=Sorangium sp. So ce1504 TaxID=3133337 RepID=UPI003F62131E